MAQPRTLSQIISELNPTYTPQIKAIQQQRAAIPQRQAIEQQGLEAKQGQAFNDILGGARRRGLGFAGIPLGEQANYTATEFLPSLARLKQSGNEESLSLQDAINQIYERRNTLAQQILSQRADRAEQQRQFNLNYKLSKQQAADARRSSGGGGFSPTLGGLSTGGGSKPSAKTNPLQQVAYDDVYTRVQQQNDDQIKSDYVATLQSAKYGNQKDLYKLQIYRKLRPDIFKATYKFEKGG